MLDAQNSWICWAWIDDDHLDSWTCQAGTDGNRHQPQSHSNIVSGTCASAPSPTLLAEDHSDSKKQHKVTWFFMLTKACAYVHYHSCSQNFWPVDVCCKRVISLMLVPTHGCADHHARWAVQAQQCPEGTAAAPVRTFWNPVSPTQSAVTAYQITASHRICHLIVLNVNSRHFCFVYTRPYRATLAYYRLL